MQDTPPAVLHRWHEVFASATAARKWQMLGDAYATARTLHAAGLLRRGEAGPEAIQRDWLRRTYRLDIPNPGLPRMSSPNLAVVREVAGVLHRLGIEYALGGSMASSIFGVARFTQDADICVAPFPGKEEAFAQSFGTEYYVSLPAIQEAIRDRTSFNLIQTREGFKVDLFVCKEDPFEQGALARRVALPLPGEADPIFVQSPEDVCLFKLRRYRLGNESSTQQWQDVLGVLSSEKDRLDRGYLSEWAARLSVNDLLDRAWKETQLD